MEAEVEVIDDDGVAGGSYLDVVDAFVVVVVVVVVGLVANRGVAVETVRLMV